MRLLSKILITVAFIVSIYLAAVSISSGTIAGCGGGSPCDKILKSDWAYLGHIPVSIPAVIVYGIVLLSLFMGRNLSNAVKVLLIGLVSSIILAVLWFVGIQVFVLKEICPYCMTSHLSGFFGAILYGIHLIKEDDGNERVKMLLSGISLGFFASVVFLAMQLTLPKPDRSVEYAVDTKLIPAGGGELVEAVPAVNSESIRNEPADTELINEAGQPVLPVEEEVVKSEPVEEESSKAIKPEIESTGIVGLPGSKANSPDPAPSDANPPEEPVPVYSIHGGEFTFPVDEIPGIGDWRAPNLMLNLIDFACDHCRVHYRTLRKRAPFYAGEIYFGILPLALNERCNPYFSMPGLPDYSNCEYARLALAVWRKAPQKYLEFVDWLCLETSPPASLDGPQWVIAKEYAEKLIGADLLNQGWNDKWVLGMMNRLTELYGYNLKLTGQMAIPQQFFNQRLRFGEITSESSFDMIMGLNFPIEIKRRK